MKVINHSIFAFALCLIVSCSTSEELDSGDKTVSFDRSVNVVDLLDTLRLDKGLLESFGLVSNDKYVFSVNRKSSPIVKIYDHRTGEYKDGFGTIGGGPGEFERVLPNGFAIRNNDIIVSGLKNIRSFEILENKGEVVTRMTSESKIPNEYVPYNFPFFLNDSIVAGYHDGSMGLFSTVNIKTQELSNFGEYPEIVPDIPQTAYHHLYQGIARISPGGSKIAATYSNFPLLRITNVADGKQKYVYVNSKYQQKQVVVAPEGRSINTFDLYKYFENVQVNDRFILSNYREYEIVRNESGQWVSNGLTDPAILVFTYDGDAVIKLMVEDWMRHYTITPDNRIIFFHPEEKDELYVIDLKPLIE